MSPRFQRTFAVSNAREPRWGTDPVEALRHEHSLESILGVGEQIQRDALALLERAAFDGQEIASASVLAQLRFADEEERSRFLNACLKALAGSLDPSSKSDGAPYRVVLAAYPATEGKEKEE